MTIIYRIALVLILTFLLDYFFTAKIKVRVFLDNWIAKKIIFKGYYTIMICGCVLSKCKHLKDSTINHESIYARQWMEMAALFLSINIVLLTFGDISLRVFLWGLLFSVGAFYITYLIEWIIRCFFNKFKADNTAYKNISYEREAYDNQDDTNYLTKRIPFNFIKYYFKKNN